MSIDLLAPSTRTARASAPATSTGAALAVVGSDLVVPLVGGTTTRYVNLDYAASAPCIVAVRDTLDELLPWYSSVHRGAGYASQVSTRLLAASRSVVGRFVGARADDHVVFTPGRSTSRRSTSTTSRSRPTSCMHPSVPACSSGAPTGSAPRRPTSRAAVQCAG